MVPIITGLVAGALHVFSGVDHLAALAPAAVADPSRATRTGMLWGFGHGLGVVIVGVIGLLFRAFIDIEAWSRWAEFIVGFLLIGIGIWAIVQARRLEFHDHQHEHDGLPHEHIHTHEPADRSHQHSVLGIGIFHGIAGGGHLFGVLPALALPTHAALLYLGSYLVASVAAMGAFAYIVGALARRSGSVWVKRLMFGSGVVAIVVGVLWVANSWPW